MTDAGVTGLGADPVAEEGDWRGWGGGGAWRPAVLTVDVECDARRVSGLQSQLCTQDDGATLTE